MTMDKDALLRDLLGVMTDMREEVSSETFRHCLAPYIARITAALAEPQGDRWIKCSERLPEDGDNVFISGVGGKGKFVAEVIYRDGDWLMFHPDTDSYCAHCHKPTHWRPLPPLPKERVMKCDGNCEVHVGEVMPYRVIHIPSQHDWGVFFYCQAAVKEDTEHREMKVTPINEAAK